MVRVGRIRFDLVERPVGAIHHGSVSLSFGADDDERASNCGRNQYYARDSRPYALRVVRVGLRDPDQKEHQAGCRQRGRYE